MNINTDDWRCELKFVVAGYSSESVYSFIKTHPAIFSEIYHERKINNIYCDTSNFQAFSDNVMGISDRLKVRIRWYGETFSSIEKPTLEFKIKSGLLSRKEYFKMNPLTINKEITANDISQAINNTKVSASAKKVLLVTKPVLINSYSRRYFRSSCKDFRITFDTNLRFYNFLGRKKNAVFANQNILEIKFNKSNIINSNNITNYFPFRLNKSSKYLTGLNLLAGMPIIY